MKKEKVLVVLVIILSILVLALGGYMFYDKVFSDSEQNVNNNSNTNSNVETNETAINDAVIKNSEVRKLYNYVQAGLNSNNVCLGYFYQNPFKNHSLKDKISLVLINYGSNYKKLIDDNFLQKVSPSDRKNMEHMKNEEYYIDADVIRKGMELIFNIAVEKFNTNASYGTWEYRSDTDAFISVGGGGNYPATVMQKVIEYNELADEINLTVVKAELGDDDDGVYRYINKTNTLVYENNADDFKFTKENISKFPQLKYVFKKNVNGKYYVSDIINLNFEEDFESCK